jgi:hypothetical protein
MAVLIPVSAKKTRLLRSTFTAALICFLVLLPSTTNAQRTAIGIGSKLKQAFGTRTVSVPRSENKPTTLQGEQEYDNNESDRALSEKPGIVVSMLAFLSGYIYLFLQRQKIVKIEQAIAGGEFQILAYLLCCIDETRGKNRVAFIALYQKKVELPSI